ncbi:cellobionic acid phosphorylase [Vibrio inusitatus NBRC 102082]|uniref:Cellobionic acid phosphorylase n=1 Tax=Vibrio inusitatus NBRC 102082 TaxID=1219070 RepID=A0A4Y3I046_9VIBR|nr:amylo-alpha-1,6-glucosidase [Vibrio inusitatus]GEA51824.1 cellobionic acid phosphorylase [Vibrio inusitatus NBRC 102082]
MLITTKQNGERVELLSPTEMPRASGFLWNKQMMIQVNCRGYATAQFMQPEPAKYMHAPNLEAKSFMQPEQPYFAHHPGRFFYIKDEETGEIFSAPYEPVRAKLDKYCFSLGQSDIQWQIEHLGIEVELCLSLPQDDVVELWQLKVKNVSGRARKISVYPYFPIGYMSWMNQSAKYREDLGGVVASCVTPYQKVADYFKNKDLKDKTYFLHDRIPTSYETIREVFEGEGGLHNPTGVQQTTLDNGNALYETPTAALQYQMDLDAEQQEDYRFLLGPAFDDVEIELKRNRYFVDTDFANTKEKYSAYVAQGKGSIEINSPDTQLNEFVNSWLPRQMFYHGDVNRLSTDPQTRNYIQDAMGMVYIKPDATRAAFLHALAQQEESGAIPDGILLTEQAELKYINQIPHTDHCIWFPVCLRAYLDETNDYAIFNQPVQQFKGTESKTAFERITNAMRWLFNERDHRGLSYIAQGDWCDPMNMVGYKGKGVSGWLSMAAAYALNIWSDICQQLGELELAAEFRSNAEALNEAVNKHIWDGDWYARGITDDDVVFGTSKDEEGRIFLNPQSWAILANTADAEKRQKMIQQVEQQLETPYGVMMLAPSFTGMRDDVGRVTQKHPGSAENGSVYNHAAIFYIFSLYQAGETDRAFKLMSQMLTGPDEADYVQRGQLPVFIPNYYRGAYYQFPRTAGRSSQLFNTGTVSWVYRCIVEGLFGLKGDDRGLSIEPQLPADWENASAVRHFRGATFEVSIQRADVTQTVVSVDGMQLSSNRIEEFEEGKTYKVEVLIA